MTDDTGKHWGAYHGTPEQYWENRENYQVGCRGCAGSRKATLSEKDRMTDYVFKGYVCDQGVSLDQDYPKHTIETCPVKLWRRANRRK